jgi:hypothetical protein
MTGILLIQVIMNLCIINVNLNSGSSLGSEDYKVFGPIISE